MKKIILILAWAISLLTASIYTYENPEMLEKVKNYFKKNKISTKLKHKEGAIFRNPGNFFIIEFAQEFLFNKKRTAFVSYDERTLNFDPKSIIGY